jgi:penicillin-binding protein 1A
VYYGAFGHLHTTEELQEFQNQTATLVLSEEGQLIGKFYSENRTNIKYEQLPKHLINALIATEDARYFKHEGVDSRSLLRVLFKTILSNKKSSGGGSTINQQLAKNMYGRKKYGPLTMPVNKTKEVFLAYRLESIYSKEDILTLYLNTVPFGENVLGIEAASRRYFNKSIGQIKIEEAAVLIGMLKANTYYNPRIYPENAIKRRNVVLSQMKKYNYLQASQKDSLQQLPLKLDYANLESEGPANYFLLQVKDEVNKILKSYNAAKDTDYTIEKDGLTITTTLDLQLQKKALGAYKSHLNVMQNRLEKLYRNSVQRKILNKLVTKELQRNKLTKNADLKQQRELFNWKGFYTDSISVRDSLRFIGIRPSNWRNKNMGWRYRFSHPTL